MLRLKISLLIFLRKFDKNLEKLEVLITKIMHKFLTFAKKLSIKPGEFTPPSIS
jgi:hypothetical protein